MTEEEYFADVTPISYCDKCGEPIYIGDYIYKDDDGYIFCSLECALKAHRIKSEEMYTGE